MPPAEPPLAMIGVSADVRDAAFLGTYAVADVPLDEPAYASAQALYEIAPRRRSQSEDIIVLVALCGHI